MAQGKTKGKLGMYSFIQTLTEHHHTTVTDLNTEKAPGQKTGQWVLGQSRQCRNERPVVAVR